MSPQDAAGYLNKTVMVNNPKISGAMTFTAYIFRIKDGRKLYQAEVRRLDPPHEIYIVSLDDLKPATM